MAAENKNKFEIKNCVEEKVPRTLKSITHFNEMQFASTGAGKYCTY